MRFGSTLRWGRRTVPQPSARVQTVSRKDVLVDYASDPPATFVQIHGPGAAWSSTLWRSAPSRLLDPRTAAVLSAVLLAAAEQVNADKLSIFKVGSALDLELLALAMAYRDDDTGLMGDVFEWSVLLGINGADEQIAQMVTDALQLAGVMVDRPQAILVAAEKGRLVGYSPDVPAGATLATGRRGRPPLITNLLGTASPSTWKADLLLGANDRWVAASLKSNPSSLLPSMKTAAGTVHPPRIGVTATMPAASGVVRDPATGSVLLKIPVDIHFLALTRAVLDEVQSAFARHLSLPSTPLLQSGIGLQLHRWRNQTVEHTLSVLGEVAGSVKLPVGDVLGTGTSAEEATASLVATNTLATDRGALPRYGSVTPIRGLLSFDPVD